MKKDGLEKSPSQLDSISLGLRNHRSLNSSIFETIEKLRVAARKRDQPPVDEHVFNVRSRVENIAVRYNDIRHLADLDRSEPVCYAQDLSRIERDRLQGFFL